MKKYRLRPQTVEAKEYEEGMEDGFMQYYWYENYSYDLYDEEKITSKSLEGLEKLRNKLKEKEEEENPIAFEHPVAIIVTNDGVKRVRKGDYIVFHSDREKDVMDKEEFISVYEEL